ncbi:MAG: phosphatase PAP2 family protein [Planctomycetales bacterium]|nr:phosphatase PAP2 family protein [Planctomycetales bacterium]
MPSDTDSSHRADAAASDSASPDIVRIRLPGGQLRLWPTCGLLFCLLGMCAFLCDGAISRWAARVDMPGDFESGLAIGEMFGHGVGVLFVLLAVFALDQHRPVVLRIACCAYLPGLLVNWIKVLAPRVRPLYAGEVTATLAGWTLDGIDQVGYAIQSFPSGHVATAVGLAVGLSWRYRRGSGLFVALACLTAAERVITRAHYLSDTLFGAGIAVLVSGGFVHARITGWVFDWFEQRKWSNSSPAIKKSSLRVVPPERRSA